MSEKDVKKQYKRDKVKVAKTYKDDVAKYELALENLKETYVFCYPEYAEFF